MQLCLMLLLFIATHSALWYQVVLTSQCGMTMKGSGSHVVTFAVSTAEQSATALTLL